ncbi:tetratricopeptide repeat protein [Oxynema aestuarii]|uniref:Tetratricopeptide repeat protein n=1 Tax=Oxynema aestuarii AP17 TaxID=2064643 RepID=A0A6H1U2W9_9CYAN|nr:tetratricopeptide repeat protein [Oxynema aestuarii]QIZ73184.1 tetratricopeptide repeat protein [Oxynema aestuarii AP17]
MLHRLWRWLTGLYRRLRQWWHKPTPTPPPSPPRPSFSATELESTFLHLLDWMEQGASRGQMKGFLIAKGIAPSQWTTWLEGFANRLSDNPTQHQELARRMVQFGELYGEEWGALAAKIGREVLAQVSEPGEKVAEPGEKVAEPGEKVAEPEEKVSEAGEKEKDEAQVWFERGKEQFNLGQYEEAIASCNEAIRLRPDYPEAYYNRGGMQHILGQYEEAIASFNEAIRLRPDYPEAYALRGAAQDNLGQYEEAIASCNEAIRLRPDYPEAYALRGAAQDNLGQYEEAIASYNEAIRLRPDFPEAYNDRGAAQRNLGQYEEAIASYNEAIRLRPDYPEAYNNRGIAQRNLGQYEEAIASYNEAIRLRPDYPEAYNNRGIAQRNLGQYEEAIASYNEAIRLRPDFPEAYNNRGAAQRNLGQYEEAIASYNEAIRLRPDYPEAYNNRGAAQDNLGQYEEAIASYNEAIRLRPDFPEAYNNRGAAQRNLGQYEEAIASYNEAIRLRRDYPEAYFNRGNAQGNLGQYEEAIASYNEAIRLRPDYPEAYNNRGAAQDNLGQYEEAIASYNEAIRLRPDYPEAYNNRGAAQDNLGQYEEAIASYDAALILKRDKWEAWAMRGQAANQVDRRNSPYLPSDLALLNPDLNQRGFEGALLTYREGLKYCQKDTHPEGWGTLHFAIGNLYDLRSRRKATNRDPDRRTAFEHYNLALETLTETAYPERHLEVLRPLIRLLLSFDEIEQAQELQRRGTDLVRRLVDCCPSPGKQRQLALQFADFKQLTVDLCVRRGEVGRAFAVAEAGKNACLSWLFYGRADAVTELDWSQMRQLLGGEIPPTPLNKGGLEGVNLNSPLGENPPAPPFPRGAGGGYTPLGTAEVSDQVAPSFPRGAGEIPPTPLNKGGLEGVNLNSPPGENPPAPPFPRGAGGGYTPLGTAEVSDQVAPSFPRGAGEIPPTPLNKGGLEGVNLNSPPGENPPAPPFPRGAGGGSTPLGTAEVSDQVAPSFPRGAGEIPPTPLNKGGLERGNLNSPLGENPPAPPFPRGAGGGSTPLGTAEVSDQVAPSFPRGAGEIPPTPLNKGGLEGVNLNSPLGENPPAPPFPRGAGEIPPTPLNKGGLEGVNLNSPLGENPPAPPFPRGAGGGSTPLGTAEVSDQVAPSFPRGAGEIPPTPLNKGGLEGVNLNSPLGENPPAPPFPRGAGGGSTPLGTAEVSDQVAPPFPRGAGEIPPTPLNKGGLEGVNLNSPLGENPPAPPFPRGAGEIPPTPLNKGGLEGVNLNSPPGENPPAPPFPRGAGGGSTPLGTAEVSDQVAPSFPRGAGEIPPTPLNKGGLEGVNLNSPLGENPPAPPFPRGAGGGYTAAVYWHWSPYALTTFILKPDRPEPTVLNHNRFQDRSEYTGNLRELEDWMQEWNRTYHRNPKDKKDKTTTQSDSWRKGLKAQLDRLAAIVQIDAILDELEDCREYQHLILIPHKDLHRLPLHGLFVNSDRFPRTCTLTYLPSAAFVRPEAPTPSDASRFDALLSVENPPSLTKTADGSHKTLAPLPAAEVESEIVARLFGRNTRLAGTDATAAALKAALQQPHSAFHFSGHGYYEFSHPIASALCLQGEDRLSVEDILSLDLSAYRLVYLSACETAVSGDETITSEYVGLTGAFARSRVAYIVSTLWSVESLGSTLFSLYFYQELERGHPEPVAFANAQQWLKTVTRDRLGDWYRQQIERFENDPSFPRSLLRNFKSWSSSIATMEETPFADPYYWSAFILCGR